MGKPTICICENKDADQLRGNREADQRLSFRYTDSTVTGWLGVSGFVDEQSDGRTDGSGPLLVPFLNKVFLRYRDPM